MKIIFTVDDYIDLIDRRLRKIKSFCSYEDSIKASEEVKFLSDELLGRCKELESLYKQKI